MATSGSIVYTYKSSPLSSWAPQLRLRWETISTSIEKNSTTIKWVYEIYYKNNVQIKTAYTITIDGVVYTKNTTMFSVGGGWTTFQEGTQEIKHNADGTKTFSYSFKETYDSANPSASGTGTLDKILQPSPVTCSTVDIGYAPMITINRNDNSLTHTLSYGFGNQELGYITGTIAEKTTATQIKDFVWPTSFYQVIPNSTSGTGTLFCDTYLGDELVGQTTYTFTANANRNASTPTINPTIKDTNATTVALTGDSNKLIRYFSTASITINAQARNYATIVSQKAKCGTSYFTTPTGAIGNIQSGYFSFEAIDSRGYKTSVGRDLEVAGRFIDYSLPTCTIGNDIPDTNGNMTVNCSGTWFSGSFGAVNNTLAAQYRYKEQNGSWGNWTSMSVSPDGDTYTATASLSGLDYQKIYVFETRVTDKLTTVSSSESSVVSLPVFHWSKEDFVFEVPVTFKKGTTGGDEGEAVEDDLIVKGDLTVKGDLRLKNEGNYGNTIYFGDGSYVSFTEDTDDDLTIKAADINLNATNLNLKGSYINLDTNGLTLRNKSINYGTWVPILSTTAAVSSYTTRSGWYQKLGNVVTIGWQLKATIKSGYQTTGISIIGAPYEPTDTASGGGMCSGTYVSGGFNFECWAIGTDKSITGRVQSCNNTSAANLSTSASGLFYPSGGGEITLSGTICYITN